MCRKDLKLTEMQFDLEETKESLIELQKKQKKFDGMLDKLNIVSSLNTLI